MERKLKEVLKKIFFYFRFTLIISIVFGFFLLLAYLSGYIQAISDYYFVHREGEKLCRITNSIEAFEKADIEKNKLFVLLGNLKEGDWHLNYIIKNNDSVKIIDYTFYMKNISEWKFALCYRLFFDEPDKYGSRSVSLLFTGFIINGKKIICY